MHWLLISPSAGIATRSSPIKMTTAYRMIKQEHGIDGIFGVLEPPACIWIGAAVKQPERQVTQQIKNRECKTVL